MSGTKTEVAVAVYAALVLSIWTPLYEPLSAGRDEWWAFVVLLVAAHLGVGWAVARAWVLALPAALSVAAFVAAGAEELAWLSLFIGLPVLVGVTAAGWLAGRRADRREPVAIGLVAIALVPVAYATVETIERGPHVPASVQRELPTELSLGNLCPGAEPSGELERDVRRRAETLIRELRARPDHLVTYTFYDAHGPDEQREITIHELAEEQLADIESGGPNCAPELERRIRAAM
jgi:hypothetical protein